MMVIATSVVCVAGSVLIFLALIHRDWMMRVSHWAARVRWNEIQISGRPMSYDEKEWNAYCLRVRNELHATKFAGQAHREVDRVTPLREKACFGGMARQEVVHELSEMIAELGRRFRTRAGSISVQQVRDPAGILAAVLGTSGDPAEIEKALTNGHDEQLIELLCATIFALHYASRLSKPPTRA